MQSSGIMMTIGIIAGILAALFQSLSYLFSRGFVIREHGSPIHLVLVSQLYMAAACIPVMILTRTPAVPALHQYLAPLISATAFYIVGQASLFFAMKEIQASRIAPMLGFKIVILALISTFILGQPVNGRQWIGVMIATAAVCILSFSGGRISLKCLITIITACTGYSLSDLSIRKLIDSLSPLTTVHASVYATSASYILCGAISLPIIMLLNKKDIFKGMRFSVPYAACWLLGMFALFLCFGSVGTILGNILQSTRGIISIIIAIPAAALGFPLIEPHVPRRIVATRMTSAVLIVLAVWFYVSGI